MNSITQYDLYIKTNGNMRHYENKFRRINPKLQHDSFSLRENSQDKILSYRSSLSFGKKISPEIYAIRNIDDLTCASCGKNMISEGELNTLIKKFSFEKGVNIAYLLDKYKTGLPEVELEVINRINNVALLSKKLKLNEILIYLAKDGSMISHKPSFDILEKKQTLIIDEAKTLLNNLVGVNSTKIILSDFFDHSLEMITLREGNTYFKRKAFLNSLHGKIENEKNTTLINTQNNIDYNKNLTILEKIYEVAKKIPSSTNDPDAFIVKNSKKPLDILVRNLFNANLATIEHIDAKANGGSNYNKNLIIECSKCNSDKGDKPLVDWLNIHPEMIINTQKQLDKIITLLNSGKLPLLRHYPEQVKETLFVESGGMINLDISKIKKDINSDKFSPDTINNNNNSRALEAEIDRILYEMNISK